MLALLMRVAFVCQYFPPEPGAPAGRVSELARAWVRRGHEVWVLTGMPNHPTGRIPPEYQGRRIAEEEWQGVRVVRTWIYATPNAGRVRRSAAFASFAISALLLGQARVPRVDVVVATTPQILCGLAGDIIARLRGVPFVLDLRDLWPESIVAVGALPARHPVIQVLEHVARRLYVDAARVVTVTDAFREILLAGGMPAHRISVVKNGVDLARFQPMPRQTALRARLGWGDKIIVEYAGTHGMAHALDRVLDAAARLTKRDDIRFLFVGEGAERSALEARARREGLANVCFLGAVPRETMPEVYASADICLVPLRRAELFTTVIPSKIFEIAAMERPILLSVDGEARAIVEASGAGRFLPPEDVDAMVEAIEDLADHPERGAEMGRRGRAFVIREFDREALAARYEVVLREIVQAGR
jgi:glycosyltransferase involved in cell wall biosynthesis